MGVGFFSSSCFCYTKQFLFARPDNYFLLDRAITFCYTGQLLFAIPG